MYIEDKEDTSVLQFLKDTFSDTPFVDIVPEYPEDNFDIPTVSMDIGVADFDYIELGSSDERRIRQYSFDIFAKMTLIINNLGIFG